MCAFRRVEEGKCIKKIFGFPITRRQDLSKDKQLLYKSDLIPFFVGEFRQEAGGSLNPLHFFCTFGPSESPIFQEYIGFFGVDSILGKAVGKS